MIDRQIKNCDDLSQIDDLLAENLAYALSQGKEILEEAKHGESFAPFTAIVLRDKVFLDPFSFEDAEASFEAASKLVSRAKGATSYAFCYDGFIETDEGCKDAIIVEGGLPSQEVGHAIAQIYEQSGDCEKGEVAYEFLENVAYLGESPNFMKDLLLKEEYTDGDLDPRFSSELN